MTFEEMFAGLKGGDMVMKTELGTRDESKQTKIFEARYGKVRIVTNLKFRALVMKDVVLPFNPTTCDTDDVYSDRVPFRPIMLVSQTLEMIKKLCADDEAIAKRWEERLGYRWSEGMKPTMDDYYAIKSAGFIHPRLTTYHTVSVFMPEEMSNSKFRRKYTVDSNELLPDCSYPPENRPIWDQAAIFFNGLVRPEWEKTKAELERKNVAPDVIQAEKRKCFAKSPVSFVSPTNLIPFICVPLGEVPTSCNPKDCKTLEKYIKFMSYTDKWPGPINEIMSDNSFDTCMDFYDLTVVTPTSDARKPSGAVYTDEDTLALFQALTVKVTDGRVAIVGGKSKLADGTQISNEDAFEKLMETARAYFLYSQSESQKEDGDTFEKIMAASNGCRPIWTINDKLIPACRVAYETQFKDSPYLTDAFKKAHSNFIVAMEPKAALEFAAEDDDDLEEANKEANSQQSVKKLIDSIRVDMGENDSEELEIEVS